MRKEVQIQVFNETSNERRDDVAELMKKDSDLQLGENSEESPTDTITVADTATKRTLHCGES